MMQHLKMFAIPGILNAEQSPFVFSIFVMTSCILIARRKMGYKLVKAIKQLLREL